MKLAYKQMIRNGYSNPIDEYQKDLSQDQFIKKSSICPVCKK